MTILPALVTKATQHFIQSFREIIYDDLAHQASDWCPDEVRIEKILHKNQPIKLDFAIPKKHRLAWSHRTIQQRPY